MMKKQLTTSIAKIMPLFDLLQKGGINVDEFLSQEGINPLIIQSPDSRLPLRTVHLLTEKATRVLDDENIGLHEGEVIAGFSSILGYILMNCSTIGEVIEKYCAYEKIGDEGKCTKLQINNSRAVIEVIIVDDNFTKERHLIDHYLVGFLTYFKLLVKKKADLNNLLEIHFVYPALNDISEYRRLFPCKLVFNSSMNALIFNRSVLDIPVPQTNKDLLSLFEGYATEILAKLTQVDSFSNRVSRLIIQQMRGETPTIEEVASKLLMSVRNLQIKLKEEGTTYHTIMDNLRRNLALQYLKDKNVPIAEISYLLGFSEPSAFHRCFKKWTNSTPANFRVND
jgi:AraC-like DNA-binding protein